MENINGKKVKILKKKETKDIKIAKDKIQKEKTEGVKMKKNNQIREREEQEEKIQARKTQKIKKYFFLFSAFKIGLLLIIFFPSLEPFKSRPLSFCMPSPGNNALFSSLLYLCRLIKEKKTEREDNKRKGRIREKILKFYLITFLIFLNITNKF